MTRFEYKVVPAPNRGLKSKGVKRAEDRFALALSTLMNQLGAEGWDYVRADILPTEERSGIASKQSVYHNMLVFRRVLEDGAETSETVLDEAEEPLALAAPEDDQEDDPEPWEEPLEESAGAPSDEATTDEEEPRREAAAD